jgi:hypothetical protein
MVATTTTSTETPEPEGVADRLRRWGASHLSVAGRGYGDVLAAAYAVLIAGNMVGLAVAQSGGNGGDLCGTAIASTVNQLSPLVLTVIVGGGLILCYLLHAYSGLKKDPQKVKEIKDWRNRAGYTAVSAPLLGKLLEIIIGFTGFAVGGCIDIVPGM